MAATLQPTEKAKIRLYLGYPDHFRYKHSRLESMLEDLSEEAADLVRESLVKLEGVETLLTAGTTTAGLKRVDEIWFETGSSQPSEQRKAGRVHVSRISIITGVPIYSDVFGTAGYLGDSFSGGGGQGSGGGFYNVG